MKHLFSKISFKAYLQVAAHTVLLSISAFGQESVLPTQLLLNEPNGFYFVIQKDGSEKQNDVKTSNHNKYLAYLPMQSKKEDGSYDLVVLDQFNKTQVCSVNIKDFESCQLDYEFSHTNEHVLFLHIKRLLKKESDCCVYNYDFLLLLRF